VTNKIRIHPSVSPCDVHPLRGSANELFCRVNCIRKP